MNITTKNPAPANSNAVCLSSANVSRLQEQAAVKVPSYIRNPVGSPTIVHISVGGFHRAHQAVYLDDLLEAGLGNGWRLVGVGLLPFDAAARDAMRAQDCLYTLVERDAIEDKARIIAAISEYFYAPEQGQAVLEVMADPTCRIVSLTITEGGYFVHEGTGNLDVNHPDIQHDAKNLGHPRSSFGYIVGALKRRKERNLPPFTILSCDNIQTNGDVAKKMLLQFARLIDPELEEWLKKAAFPNCMVDRITPATTDFHRKLVREKFGVDDLWPVTCETFKQWVIEDHFPQGRPAWEKVGAQMVADVLPYERMKLRLLNGSYLALCYIGMLLGYRFAPDAMQNPDVFVLLCRLMDEEVTHLLSPIPGIDLEAYKAMLLVRFANPAVNDQLVRIGAQGSARIPKFILPSIREALARGTPSRFLTFTVACWCYYMAQVNDETGRALDFVGPFLGKSDPWLEKVQTIARTSGKDVTPLLGIKEIFGDDLSRDIRFIDQVSDAVSQLHDNGPKASLRNYVTWRHE